MSTTIYIDQDLFDFIEKCFPPTVANPSSSADVRRWMGIGGPVCFKKLAEDTIGHKIVINSWNFRGSFKHVAVWTTELKINKKYYFIPCSIMDALLNCYCPISIDGDAGVS